jgi:hypothetical protein
MTLRKVSIAILTLMIALATIYTFAWFIIAGIIDREARGALQNIAAQGVTFDGTLAYPQGFPGKYVLKYSGDIVNKNGTLSLPLLEIIGWPLRGEEILLRAPMGLEIKADGLHPELRKLENAAVSFVVPQEMPEMLAEQFIRAWQLAGHAQFDIPAVTLQWRDANLFGEAHLALDDALQPQAEAQIGVSNYTFFVDIMADTVKLKQQEKFMILTLLSALDKQSGMVTLPVRIDNGALYIHMARIADLPEITWPPLPARYRDAAPASDIPPDRHQ